MSALVEKLEALSAKVRGREDVESEIRMLFNEALAGGANMNGDGGFIIHTEGHAHDLLDAIQCISELRAEIKALKATSKETDHE